MSEPKRGYYSLIQYCPDPARAEVANLGVVLFCPERGFLDVRVSPTNDRVRQFFGEGSYDDWALNSGKKALCARLRDDRESFRALEDLERFALSRANALTLTPPRPMKVINPVQELETLYRELVGPLSDRETNPPRDPEPNGQPPFRERAKGNGTEQNEGNAART